MFDLRLGDCLEVMADIPDNSVDLILCDLPYGTTACKWDSVIPFAPLWAQYKRIAKKNAAIVLTAAQPFTSALISSNARMFKYCWVWEKSAPGGFAHAKNMPLKKHEDIAVFSTGATAHASRSGRRMAYNPQGLVRDPRVAKNSKRHGQESAFGNRPSHKCDYVQEYTNYPSTVLRFAVERGNHPTQKPVALMEYLIRTYTNEGETVLDNCMGSGTTGVACANTDRRFIGIERDPGYFEIARQRIEQAHQSVA
jgi:site-specific DNA-methyltransferase (adenine-specific)